MSHDMRGNINLCQCKQINDLIKILMIGVSSTVIADVCWPLDFHDYSFSLWGKCYLWPKCCCHPKQTSAGATTVLRFSPCFCGCSNCWLQVSSSSNCTDYCQHLCVSRCLWLTDVSKSSTCTSLLHDNVLKSCALERGEKNHTFKSKPGVHNHTINIS